MSTITTRAGKGSPLTNNEVDANFTNLNTDKAELSGATFTGEIVANAGIALGDNDKATFGAGDDLQIYHDGNHSYIQDSGSGNLRILVGDLQIRNYGSNENVITSTSNAEVALYHNASQKLATTTTGIDVTGTVTADELTVDGTNGAYTIASNGNDFYYGRNGSNYHIAGTANGAFNFLTGASSANRLKIASNGDISFYEDTGTTPKLFWDASAESLGIGATSPQKSLDVEGSIRAKNAAGTSSAEIDITSGGTWRLRSNATSGTNSYGLDIVKGSAGTDVKMSIDSSGNAGIGATPSAWRSLDTAVDVGDTISLVYQAGDLGGITNNHYFNSSNQRIYKKNGYANMYLIGDGGAHKWFNAASGTAGNSISFSQAMTLDAAGNLLVGKTVSSFTTAGVELAQGGTAGKVQIQRSSSPLALVNLTDDGNILNFYKGTSAVGSIGTYSGDLTIGDDDVGIRFDTGTGLVPWDLGATTTGGSATNGTIDLGVSGARFKDLYLSGYAYVGALKTNNSVESVGNLTFWVPNVGEAARIEQNTGNLLVGTTSVIGSSKHSVRQPSLYYNGAGIGIQDGNSTTGGSFISFHQESGTLIGRISRDGANTVSYATSSDQRLKENIADADDAGSKIDSIQVRKYDWKADGSHQDYGMIAQELQTVAPEAVSGDADSEEMMGVDYSKLVPMLIKEIQSLRNRVAQLEE